jgi:CheY-like chemotaxis protein
VSGRGRLLLVDDEADIRLVAGMSLERVGGWQVVATGSAGEAVDAARAGRFDGILLDVMMPDVDGPATLALLRPIVGPDVPVVFLTAKVGAVDRQRLEALGAGVVAKPFDPIALPDQVAAALGLA